MRIFLHYLLLLMWKNAIVLFTPLRIEDAQSAALVSLNEKMCKMPTPRMVGV